MLYHAIRFSTIKPGKTTLIYCNSNILVYLQQPNSLFMANLIVIRGIINAGKTTTCGFIYEDLLSIVQTAHSFNNVDVNAYSLRYTQPHK